MLTLETFAHYGELGIVKKGKSGCVSGWEIGMCQEHGKSVTFSKREGILCIYIEKAVKYISLKNRKEKYRKDIKNPVMRSMF